jgi:hypothetical protein
MMINRGLVMHLMPVPGGVAFNPSVTDRIGAVRELGGIQRKVKGRTGHIAADRRTIKHPLLHKGAGIGIVSLIAEKCAIQCDRGGNRISAFPARWCRRDYTRIELQVIEMVRSRCGTIAAWACRPARAQNPGPARQR